MPSHDPYPMKSEAAQRLIEGQQDEQGSTNWSSMQFEANERQSGRNDDNDDDDADAAQGLTGNNTNNNKNDTFDDDEDNDSDDDEDAFLDRPVYESRQQQHRLHHQILRRVRRGAGRVYRRLYGDDVPVAEFVRVLTLATTLFFMIGGYWLLRSLKDPIMIAMNGVEYIPQAKILSVVVVLAVVSIYNRFLDSDIPRHRLFYLFGTFYFGLFVCIAFALMHPTIGLPNEQPSKYRALGWISYCGIESFGSVMVSLFWSFANSNFSLESAKACYGIMVATAQVGSIIGPTVVNRYATTWGPAKCYLVGALCMLLLQGTMATYIRIYGVAERNAATTTTTTKTKKKVNVLEGLQLFARYHYVKGIFAISCLFMVEVTIVDYTMKVLAREHFAAEHPCEMGMSCWDYSAEADHGTSKAATDALTAFMGFFGQATNTLSLLLSLLGTSAVIRTLGLRTTLLLFPSLCLGVIIMVRLHPTLYVVFCAMMMLKANSYALNNPTKEMLYQPTSSAVRYKAKSWIDIFGARGSKALGSLVTNAFSDSAARLVANGSLVGMCVASFLIWNATFMGRKFEEYTSSGHVVGAELEEDMEQAHVEMASEQNEQPNTSCAIDDDDDDDDLDDDDDDKNDEDEEQPAAVKARVAKV